MTQSSDEQFNKILKDAGSVWNAAETRTLIEGVIAAPGDDGGMGGPEDWLDLIAPQPTTELRQQATALYAELSQANSKADTPSPEARLSALRAEMAAQGVDGFVIPLADEFQGEYIPKRAQRLAWLTGFTGSAGVAVVLKDHAAVFTDGRYTLQIAEQVDGTLYELLHISENPPDEWISEHLGEGGRLGFDPWLHTTDGARRLRSACARSKGELVAADHNLVDAIWTDQPSAPISPAVLQEIEYAGKSSSEKRREIADGLKAEGQDALIMTASPSVAWLANLRGGDVPYTPLPLGFAVLHADTTLDLFIDPKKLGPTADKLEAGLRVQDPSSFEAALTRLGEAKKTVQIDPAGTAQAIADVLEKSGATLAKGSDPCALPKACKNPVEIDGTRAAHRRDGAALTRFLAWLDAAAADGSQTEISVADKLESFRRENNLIRGLSFPTISGAGANGAIVHYRVTESSNSALKPGSLYLVDSGAQYLDGTTDVTRTVAIGTPTDEMKNRFTRVLKGHIGLGSVRFPKGTTGSQLDVLARAGLWEAGLDYDHGTGHGVGSFLGVHEGPHRISKVPSTVALEPGMIVSNEPGYYKTGEYGIRIENLVLVISSERPENDEREMLEFETLTLAPIDQRLIDRSLLTAAETAWLDAYHARVRDIIGPSVDDATGDWLKQATAPLHG
ncbi:MAG: aminopeptidase P family protein [Proteobacteria bacterium]|nr:aminopeptidase P family protein [Pseudomonadota bacterium]